MRKYLPERGVVANFGGVSFASKEEELDTLISLTLLQDTERGKQEGLLHLQTTILENFTSCEGRLSVTIETSVLNIQRSPCHVARRLQLCRSSCQDHHP